MAYKDLESVLPVDAFWDLEGGAWEKALAHGVWDRSAGQELDVTFSGLDASKTSNLRAYFLINEDLANFDAAISGEGGVLV